MKKSSMLLLVALLDLFAPPVLAAQANALWENPGWSACMARYKKTYNAVRAEPVYYAYNGQQCGTSGAPGESGCVMKIFGPNRHWLVDRKGYEVALECGKTVHDLDTICTNRADRYNAQFLHKVRTDPRCKGFPKLASEKLAVRSEASNPSGHLMSSDYGNLPESIRFGNDNSDPKCRQAVAAVRRLENHPSFESDRSIRLRWQEKFDLANAMGCKL